MTYMLLIYGQEDAWTCAEREQCYVESTELAEELQQQGRYRGAAPLEPVATAKSLRVRDGKAVVTGGPFAETREQLGGFFLIEATDVEEALAIAARIPGARKGTVEVRPVHELTRLPQS